MSDWELDKKWSDHANVFIKRIIGEHLIQIAEPEDDEKYNTDMLVLRTCRIACRMRKKKLWDDEFGNRLEFTIRNKRPSGVETELSKILNGYGDYMFYGFDDGNGGIAGYTLFDLRKFSDWHVQYQKEHGQPPGQQMWNKDGVGFRVFDWASVPKELIVHQELNSIDPLAWAR